MQQITPQALSAWLKDAKRPQPVLLDVREPWETQTCQIAGSRLIPMGEVPARLQELEPGAEVVVICHRGGRSMQVAQFLGAQGYARVHNLAGGVDAWAKTVDPSMPVY